MANEGSVGGRYLSLLLPARVTYDTHTHTETRVSARGLCSLTQEALSPAILPRSFAFPWRASERYNIETLSILPAPPPSRTLVFSESQLETISDMAELALAHAGISPSADAMGHTSSDCPGPATLEDIPEDVLTYLCESLPNIDYVCVADRHPLLMGRDCSASRFLGSECR